LKENEVMVLPVTAIFTIVTLGTQATAGQPQEVFDEAVVGLGSSSSVPSGPSAKGVLDVERLLDADDAFGLRL
jgi:hypothetical protein